MIADDADDDGALLLQALANAATNEPLPAAAAPQLVVAREDQQQQQLVGATSDDRKLLHPPAPPPPRTAALIPFEPSLAEGRHAAPHASDDHAGIKSDEAVANALHYQRQQGPRSAAAAATTPPHSTNSSSSIRSGGIAVLGASSSQMAPAATTAAAVAVVTERRSGLRIVPPSVLPSTVTQATLRDVCSDGRTYCPLAALVSSTLLQRQQRRSQQQSAADGALCAVGVVTKRFDLKRPSNDTKKEKADGGGGEDARAPTVLKAGVRQSDARAENGQLEEGVATGDADNKAGSDAAAYGTVRLWDMLVGGAVPPRPPLAGGRPQKEGGHPRGGPSGGTVSLVLSGTAFRLLFLRLDVGAVVLLRDPEVVGDGGATTGGGGGTDRPLKVRDPSQIVVLGRAADLGLCRATTKAAGNPCQQLVNTARLPYCVYHLSQATADAKGRTTTTTTAAPPPPSVPLAQRILFATTPRNSFGAPSPPPPPQQQPQQPPPALLGTRERFVATKAGAVVHGGSGCGVAVSATGRGGDMGIQGPSSAAAASGGDFCFAHVGTAPLRPAASIDAAARQLGGSAAAVAPVAMPSSGGRTTNNNNNNNARTSATAAPQQPSATAAPPPHPFGWWGSTVVAAAAQQQAAEAARMGLRALAAAPTAVAGVVVGTRSLVPPSSSSAAAAAPPSRKCPPRDPSATAAPPGGPPAAVGQHLVPLAPGMMERPRLFAPIGANKRQREEDEAELAALVAARARKQQVPAPPSDAMTRKKPPPPHRAEGGGITPGSGSGNGSNSRNLHNEADDGEGTNNVECRARAAARSGEEPTTRTPVGEAASPDAKAPTPRATPAGGGQRQPKKVPPSAAFSDEYAAALVASSALLQQRKGASGGIAGASIRLDLGGARPTAALPAAATRPPLLAVARDERGSGSAEKERTRRGEGQEEQQKNNKVVVAAATAFAKAVAAATPLPQQQPPLLGAAGSRRTQQQQPSAMAVTTMAKTASSRHGAALAQDDNDRVEQRIAAIEAQGVLWDALNGITEAPAVAFYCADCDQFSYAVRRACQSGGHRVVRQETVKRWFRCGQCGYRLMQLGPKPPFRTPCPRCVGTVVIDWIRTTAAPDAAVRLPSAIAAAVAAGNCGERPQQTSFGDDDDLEVV